MVRVEDLAPASRSLTPIPIRVIIHADWMGSKPEGGWVSVTDQLCPIPSLHCTTPVTESIMLEQRTS